MKRRAKNVISSINVKPLSATEEKFMQVIWAHPEGIFSNEIYSHFNQTMGTKSSILFKISQKGYVDTKQVGKHHIYTARISQSDYAQALAQHKIKKVLGNTSFESLIASFSGKAFNDNQIKQLKSFLEELENDIPND